MVKASYTLISIIVPIFNEEESVDLLFKSITNVMKQNDMDYEIIFIDDGSRDNTFEILKSIAQRNPKLRIIKFRKNYGQTPAMVAGIDLAKGDILLTMDGDLQNDPEDIPNFIKKIKKGFDFVVGWRYKRHDKLISRKIPSIVANWLIGKVTGVPIKDNGCSLKAYRSGIIKSIPLYSEMHRFLPVMSSIAGIKIAEIKVRHHPRKFGKSKYGLSRIYKVLLDLTSIKIITSFSNRPLLFFGHMSLFALLVSILVILISFYRFFFMPGEPIVVLLGISLLSGSLASFLLLCGVLCELIYSTASFRIEDLSKITKVNL